MTTTSLPAAVSDARSNKPELVVHAAQVLGRSKQRRAIFEVIYRGKKRTKTLPEIAKTTGLSVQRIRQEAGRLANEQLIGKMQVQGRLAYCQDPFYQAQKAKILRLVENPSSIEKVVTKRRPQIGVDVRVSGRGQGSRLAAAEHVTIDSIDSFAAVRDVEVPTNSPVLSEEDFQNGIQRVIREGGTFTDWGGEQNDLFTTRVKLAGKRVRAAFAFKGPGRKGVLRPKDMGKNGDQIERLMKSPADLFMVHYHGQVEQGVYHQLEVFARHKALTEARTIYFGVIDGDDARRLTTAYPREFARRETRGGSKAS